MRSSISLSATVPITTTQDILMAQYTSFAISAQTITGTVSLVANQCNQDASTNNCTLAVNIYVVSNDGATVRGVLFSVYGTGTNFSFASANAKIVSLGTLTSQIAQEGDRIVVEMGVRTTAPTTAGSASLLLATTSINDSALSTGAGLANSWVEFSQDIYADTNLGNYGNYVRVGNGMSRSEMAN